MPRDEERDDLVAELLVAHPVGSVVGGEKPGQQIACPVGILPALVNELILLVKASSLVSLVGIFEITRASQAAARACAARLCGLSTVS